LFFGGGGRRAFLLGRTRRSCGACGGRRCSVGGARSAGERDGSGGANDYTASASAPELTTVGTLAVTKTADVTTAAIGDTVTYTVTVTVTVTVAQGRTVVSLADTLPAGLVFVSGTAALTTPGGWTITGFNANTVNQTLTVTNPGTTDNAASLESASFTYTYEVLVQNVAGNQAGATRTNAIVATADLNNDGDTGDTGESDNDADTVTLTEPSLTLTKVTTTTGSDAGDAVVYTLTITNSNAANTSTAYDINVTDLLDNDIELINTTLASGIVVTGATVSANTSTTGSLNLVLQSLAPGASATITLNAVVKATAPAGATVANTASITYTSTPGDNPDERDGSGGTDDYTDSDTSASFTLATPVIDKLDSVTTGVAVGGTFSYDIDITLSEGVTRDLVITDLLPAGLILVGTSIDDSGFVGTLPSPVITGGLTSGQDIVLNFGDVTTDDDNDTANNTFRVTVTVRAVNELASQAPATTFENTATLAYTNGTTLATATVTDPTAPDAVVLTEPVVTVDKTVTDDTTPHLGQTITYRIVLTNTGTSTAYEVVFNDLILADLVGVAITGEVLAGGATLNAPGGGAAFNGTNTGLTGAYDIPVGGTVTITYTALVSSDPAVVGGTFNNADEDRNSSVTVTYSSLDGNPAEARDGADGSAGLNNYTATDDAPITLVGPGLRIDKTDGLASVTAGQTWDYTLTVSNVGTDTATGVVVTGLLPPQITLGQVRVNGVPATINPIAGGFTVAVPDIAAGDSATVVVTVTLDAVIDAARENLTNTASVTHDDVEPTPVDNTDDDTNVIAATPGIGVVKSVSSVNGAPPALNGDGQPVVAPGDTVIYTIVLTNTGTQDVVVDITDTFPRIVLDLANATIDDSDTGVAASINLATGVIRWTNVALDVGETITITIEAEAFDPQLQALDTFPNTVLISDITDEVPDEEDTVVADLSAFPDLVVTKVNSTDRIGINDIFTYTITLTNAGDQNAENVTVVDTLPPFVEFIGASGNFIFDPVARTVTWNSADNPELAIVDGRDAETITYTLTVKLPLNSIVFGDLTNTVRAFDDGTNGPDLNPPDNEDTQTTDVLGFLYDRLRNFSDPRGDEDDNPYELGLPIEVYRDAILPIAPIYSGAAEPGSTLEVVLYNADGNVLGRQTVVVDTGGSWMASFPGTIMKDYPQSVVITQTPAAASSDGSSQGYNLRPYYATAINAGHFFRENLNVARVTEQTPTRVTEDLQEALSNPIGFAIDAASYESLASPGHPTGR
jgi:large repetitive protein